jgi:serine/threonine protein kinase
VLPSRASKMPVEAPQRTTIFSLPYADERAMPELRAHLSTAALADRYTLQRELGRGGTATVCLAQDARHHRQVALKVMRGCG